MSVTDFDELAETWDEEPKRRERTRAITTEIRRRCRLGADVSVLEIGAGTGAIGRGLAEDAGPIVLLDSSEAMIRVARRRIAEEDLGRVRAVHGGLGEVAGQTYDLLIASMVLHHMDDTDAALGRFASLLADGGQVAIADLDTDIEGHYHGEGFNGYHGFDREELGQALSRAGFGELEWDTVFHMIKTAADGQERVFPIFLVTARKLGARSHQTVGE